MAAAYALLGLTTSLAVAWLGSLVALNLPEYDNGFHDGWTIEVYLDPWCAMVVATSALDHEGEPQFDDMWSPETNLDWAGLDQPRETVDSKLEAIGAGWPWVCVTGVRYRADVVFVPEWDFTETGVLHGANPLGAGAMSWLSSDLAPREFSHLPTRPWWPGLLFNTAVFALAWFVLWRAVWLLRWARRAGRRRHGRCVACGASVAGCRSMPGVRDRAVGAMRMVVARRGGRRGAAGDAPGRRRDGADCAVPGGR